MRITRELNDSDWVKFVASCIKEEINGSLICTIMKYAKGGCIKVTEVENDSIFTKGYYDLEFEIYRVEMLTFLEECNEKDLSVMVI